MPSPTATLGRINVRWHLQKHPVCSETQLRTGEAEPATALLRINWRSLGRELVGCGLSHAGWWRPSEKVSRRRAETVPRVLQFTQGPR